MKQPAVYIVSNKHRTVFYTGVTSNLIQRIAQHKSMSIEGFTKRYRCVDLLYYEQAECMETAILREKQIKGYRREKKLALVAKQNPACIDLYSIII